MVKGTAMLAKNKDVPMFMDDKGLRKDILRCSAQDYDLLERENKEYYERQFRSHCRRVWQRLEVGKRQKIREWMKRNKPEYSDDMWCIEEIQKLLKKESLPYFHHFS